MQEQEPRHDQNEAHRLCAVWGGMHNKKKQKQKIIKKKVRPVLEYAMMHSMSLLRHQVHSLLLDMNVPRQELNGTKLDLLKMLAQLAFPYESAQQHDAIAAECAERTTAEEKFECGIDDVYAVLR